jgi:flagellin-like hook-associated protein FlgL
MGRGGKLSDYEFKNVLDAANGAYVVNGAYSGVSNSIPGQPPKNNAVVATIQEMLNGNIADVRLNAKEASTAFSIIQTFIDAVNNIDTNLADMEALSKKAGSGDYSKVQVEQMQKEFDELAGYINEIVKGTEHNYNKIFTADGKAVSLPIGNGSWVTIFAKDLSIDVEGLDLTNAPEDALFHVRKVIDFVAEYNDYLTRQFRRAENATAVIESKMESAAGVDLRDFTVWLAGETASHLSNNILQDTSTSLDTQANLDSSRALQLLKDNN